MEEREMFENVTGVWLSREILLNKELTTNEKMLFAYIHSLSKTKKGFFASNAYIAELLGISKSRVSHLVTSLKNKGYINVHITYKKGSKQVEKRQIVVTNKWVKIMLESYPNPIAENSYTPIAENSYTPIAKNATPIAKNSKDIIKGYNKDFDNKDIKDIVELEKTAPNNDSTPLNKNNEMIKEIIEYLNHVTNSKYRYKTAATQKLLNARINEGYTMADFKRVIDVKASQWLNSDMEKFLRPSTLFNATKFDNYANEKPIKPRTNDFKQNRQNDKPKQFEGLKNDVERLQPLLDYTEIADVKQFEMLLTEFKKRYPGGEGLSQELKDMKATSVFSKEERQFTMYVKTELMAGRGDWIVKAITGQLV